MNAGEFAYNHFTLDELRSLAASPQVGTMQAMPQSFRALADRVGEVADLLTHAQADLPNWWKGPAADQAAATLGRAAAEAREFQGSALTAASTVSRCAQVVAEQQHQMMNVPEMPEPGITDVVQRPKTPIEALEAARQDARYQAAHEQAVQVVNGIAAQYAEARNELALITTTRGENFIDTFTIPRPPAKNKEGTLASDSNDTEYQRDYGTQLDKQQYEPLAITPIEGVNLNEKEPTLPKSTKPRFNSSEREREQSLPELQASSSASHSGSHFGTSENANMAPIPVGPALRQEETGEGHTDKRTELDTTNNVSAPDEQAATSWRREPGRINDQMEPETHNTLPSRRLQRRRNKDAYVNQSRIEEYEHAGIANVDHQISAGIDNPTLMSPQPARRPENEVIDGNSTTIPPYSGIGHLGRVREERNMRPAYLKERKSTWLPDTCAAPADGVIRPDSP